MLCLDESTPIILALSLAGAVLLIVGGSLWGTGDSLGNRTQMAAGVGLFCASLLLLCLAGLGVWCNKCFCTPERRSRLALRLYGKANKQQPPPPTALGDADIDLADCGSLGSSFRSFRSSRRSVRSHGTRRDRVQPISDIVGKQQTPQHQQTPAASGHPHQAVVAVAIPEAASEEAPPPAQQLTTSIDDVSSVASDQIDDAAVTTAVPAASTAHHDNAAAPTSC